MSYVDGFVLPVPEKHLKEYRRIASKAGKVWREHGALQYVEAIGDDMKTKGMAAFPKLAGAKRGEVVIFSWIMYKSKAHRNQVNKKVMADPRLNAMMQLGAVPFDIARMAYGGFKVVVDA